MKNYYDKEIIIAQCDKNGNILGPIERWEAHKNGILHRAFTVALAYKGKYILQHRKHPVFDGVFDITSSSHQAFDGKKLEDTIQASIKTLKREWGISKKDIKKISLESPVYYKAKDTFSIYIEHEVCDTVIAEISTLPKINPDYSYGYSLMTKDELYKKGRSQSLLAPWVLKMIEEKLL